MDKEKYEFRSIDEHIHRFFIFFGNCWREFLRMHAIRVCQMKLNAARSHRHEFGQI